MMGPMDDSNSVGAVVLARMDSSRLPGKALIPVNGTPLIEAIYRRLLQTKSLNKIILATTSRDCDAPLAKHFEKMGGTVYYGSDAEVKNVTDRFVSAAKSESLRYALRVNGDSPFPDPTLIEEGLQLALKSGSDLTTNLIPRTFPYGIAVEWIKVEKLSQALAQIQKSDLEHVTSHIYKNPGDFTIRSLPPMPEPSAKTRLTVDIACDVPRIERLLKLARKDSINVTTPELIAAARKIA